MNEQELKAIAMQKIEKALSMELPAETTAIYIQAFAMLTAKGDSEHTKKETVKV